MFMSINICLVVALVSLCLSWQTAEVCKRWISSNWPMHAVAGYVCCKWLVFSQMQQHKSFSVMEFATSNVDLKPPRGVNLWGHIFWMCSLDVWSRVSDRTEASLTRSCCSGTDEMKRKLSPGGCFRGEETLSHCISLLGLSGTGWWWLRAKALGWVMDTWGLLRKCHTSRSHVGQREVLFMLSSSKPAQTMTSKFKRSRSQIF